MTAQVHALDGGVSSEIRIQQTEGGPIVVKRALERLKVEADWRANPNRSHIEVRALRAAATLLGPDRVPSVLWEDQATHAFAMTMADPALHNWKKSLLAGDIDLRTAKSVGRALGELHLRSSTNLELATEFADLENFRELRVEPFFVRVAEKIPDIALSIQQVVETMAGRRTVLVHGDYSPKNMLANGERLTLLDFEVAHWGDPAFDLGFCAAHLILKAWRQGADAAAFLRALDTFSSSYEAVRGSQAIDSHLTRLTACLLLARIDGDSPVDYLASLNSERVRSAARFLLDFGDSRLIRSLQKAPG